MKNLIYYIFLLFLICCTLTSCNNKYHVIDEQTDIPIYIIPDYKNVTVPPNIAPLNFGLTTDSINNKFAKTFAIFENDKNYHFEITAKNGYFNIPPKKWKKLLSIATNIKITIIRQENGKWKSYRPFRIDVSKEPVDGWIAYRLIEPGYETWNKMGIYQRNLETYDEYTIYENTMTNYNCVNCHSFCNRDPGKMLFHMRAEYPGTIIIDGEKIEILNTKTPQTISPLVYPSWHPSGNYIAFSINKTFQSFPAKSRVEVYDTESDVVVYDIRNHTIISSKAIFSKLNFETFPTFSADGKTLYYCTAPACRMPDSIAQLRYNLCSVSFDANTGTFGNKVDTLINANIENKSVSFPRVSPNGKYIVCTVSSYGTFPIWHKDADLYIVNLKTKQGRFMDKVNSNEAESYHSWSSNSHWLVFSSRRGDGLYTRPFLTYIDSNGDEHKPFIMPQKKHFFYENFNKSFNIPEFIVNKVPNNAYQISNLSKNNKQVSISFLMR